ncbi:MAG: hypothetical protein WD404_06535 [Solirubrobacterales bacterium]
MKLQVKIALVTGALALGASPAALAAGQPDSVPPYGNGAPSETPSNSNGENANGGKPDPTPGPKAGLPAKAKAYGVHCRGESKKHVKGEKGTAFSRCVTAMAKAANGERTHPRKACQGLSKKHIKGEKGTEFSRCVKAAAQLKREQRRAEREAEETETAV